MAAKARDPDARPAETVVETMQSRWWGDRETKGIIAPPGSGAMGMKLFLASITMLFGSTIVAYLVVRYWPAWEETAVRRGFPMTLWASTLLLFGSSWPLYSALSAVRRDDQAGLRRGLTLATVLGVAFVVGQLVSWVELLTSVSEQQLRGLQVFTFYMLTVTHALHVIGGIIPMAITTRNARRGHYDSLFHPAVLYCNWYWHYLGVVWAVLFGLLLIFS